MTKTRAHIAAKILLDTKSVLFNAQQPFHYVSGNIGPVYIDCRRLLSFPEERSTLMDLSVDKLEQKIGAKHIDIVAGAETAGIPYGALIADRMNKPMIYVRKKPKGHGRMSQIEGYIEEGGSPNVLLVEDLQNFGASKKVFVDALRNTGAQVKDFFVLFNYGIHSQVDKDNEEMGLTVHALATWFDVLQFAKDENYFDTATLSSVEEFLNDPEGWNTKNSDRAAQ